jgi:hypothetical protein
MCCEPLLRSQAREQQIIDTSYHMCKLRITVGCFQFLNFKHNFMYFSVQAFKEIDKYNIII